MNEENDNLEFTNPFKFDIQAFKKSGEFPISIIPQTGFINSYCKYACKCSDAPMPFHIATAMSLLGTVSKDRYYLFGNNRKYLNLWIVIIAGTAFFRKSSATKTGINLLKTITKNKNETHLFSTDFSTEKLMVEIAEKKTGLIHWDELSGALSRFSRSYMVGAKELLTEMFEGAYFTRRLKKSEDIIIDNPQISILASTTFEWFEQFVQKVDVFSGWLNRFVYFYIKNKPRDWSFPPCNENELVFEQLVLRDILHEIADKKGEIILTEEAKKLYDVYYKKFEKDLTQRESLIKSIYLRHPLYCLKFACLYAINDNSSIVSKDNMLMAIELIEWLLKCSYIENSERLLTDNFYRTNRQIYNRIKRNGKQGIKRETLYLQSHLNAKILDEHLRTLTESGEIKEELVLAKDSNRQRKEYFANNL